MAGLPLLYVFGCTEPRQRLYLGNRGRLCSFPGLVLPPSPGAVCDPFGIVRNPSDTSQGPGRAASFHPVQLGRCRQTDTLRDSCPR